MLPDFPSLKAEIQKIIFAKLRQSVNTADPLISRVKQFTQHEGMHLQYEQYGGTKVLETFEQIGAEFEIKLAEVPDLVGEELQAKLQEMATKMASQSAKFFFDKVAENCRKAGTAMDAKGQPVSADMLLKMMESVETDFGPDGKPTNSFVIHPDMLPAVKKVADEIENDPELKRRHTEILDRQREAWAARESDRKLVD